MTLGGALEAGTGAASEQHGLVPVRARSLCREQSTGWSREGFLFHVSTRYSFKLNPLFNPQGGLAIHRKAALEAATGLTSLIATSSHFPGPNTEARQCNVHVH